jgi:hypothetical protein
MTFVFLSSELYDVKFSNGDCYIIWCHKNKTIITNFICGTGLNCFSLSKNISFVGGTEGFLKCTIFVFSKATFNALCLYHVLRIYNSFSLLVGYYATCNGYLIKPIYIN